MPPFSASSRPSRSDAQLDVAPLLRRVLQDAADTNPSRARPYPCRRADAASSICSLRFPVLNRWHGSLPAPHAGAQSVPRLRGGSPRRFRPFSSIGKPITPISNDIRIVADAMKTARSRPGQLRPIRQPTSGNDSTPASVIRAAQRRRWWSSRTVRTPGTAFATPCFAAPRLATQRSTQTHAKRSPYKRTHHGRDITEQARRPAGDRRDAPSINARPMMCGNCSPSRITPSR